MNFAVRSAFETAAGLIYKGANLDVFGRYKWLKQTGDWTPQQRNEWRLQRLGDILQFAWEHVPFYRQYWGDHGVQFFRPKSLEELQHYPILDKSTFRSNATRIVPDNLSSIRHMMWHTGGTTGEPVHYGRDLDQWVLCEAFHLWGWAQAGYRFGDPVGVIAGGSLIPERKTFKSWLRGWMHRRLFLYGITMDAAIARDYHAQLQSFGVEFLYGYPSVLYLFAKQLADQNLKLPKLRAVVTTAEMLLPQYRQGIESVFGCRVFNNLGCNDGGFESYECSRHDGFHYNDLQAILETDHPDSNGHHRLLVTNLWNKSTPFIRYENGDLVNLSHDRCSCGAPFPMIASIQGRTADILTFANGKSLAGPALTLIFKDMEIDGWQIVQTSASKLEVRIATREPLRQDYSERIRCILNRYLNDRQNDIEIDIHRVDRLQAAASGKLKPIWKAPSL